jgi:DNA-binding response OmpR family regulator
MRALIVSPSTKTNEGIQERLHREGMIVDLTDSGEGLELGGIDYDVVLLYYDRGGEDVLRNIRAAQIRVPVIALTRFSDRRRLRPWQVGADDVVTMPCLGEELVARMRALVRRSMGHAAPVLRIGPLTFDLDRREILDGTRRVRLTPNQYRLFELLALRLDRVVTKAELMQHIYATDADEPAVKIIDVMISKIRAKLPPGLIETVYGLGDKLLQEPAAKLLVAA